jgi:Ca2+-binding RTX toxin-like protein
MTSMVGRPFDRVADVRGTRTLLVPFALVTAMLLPVGASGAPSSITVDTATDSFDGACDDDDCTLRDALASVADGGTVELPPGSYALSIAGSGGLEEGDLDLTRPVTIARQGEGGVFVDASHLGDRVFQVDGDADVVVEGLTMLGGRGSFRGAGVRVVTGSVRLRDVTIVGGSAGEGGGGLSVGRQGSAIVSRSLFVDNQARGAGGGIEVTGRLTMSDSAVVGNRARLGGGVDARSATLRLENVTIAANRGRSVGGGLRASGSVVLSHVTIAKNRADIGGGVAAPPGVVTFARSIVADNVAHTSPSCDARGDSVGANVEGVTDRCGFDRTSDVVRADVGLLALRSNGGPTPTLALSATNPAIGIAQAGCNARDQRGAPRGTPCDAGAYERVLCLGRPVNIVGTPGADELSGGREPDTFLGLGGDDEFQGSLADDRACGGPGDDHLIGGPGDDVLAGQDGHDLLEGEDGDDRLLGGLGADACRGGPGRDAAVACEPPGRRTAGLPHDAATGGWPVHE